MSGVTPVINGHVNNMYEGINRGTNANNKNVGRIVAPVVPTYSEYIDCTDLYSQKEIKSIIKKLGTESTDIPSALYTPRYTVAYYRNSGALVIDNKARTNDTIEILKDGSVRHVGSWHNKEVAPAGSHTDIVEDALSRIKEDLTH